MLGFSLLESTKFTGYLILAFTVVGAAGAAIAAKPSDRFDKRFVAMAGGSVMIAALVVFIASHAVAGAVAATCVAGIGWGVFLVADWALACRIMPGGIRRVNDGRLELGPRSAADRSSGVHDMGSDAFPGNRGGEGSA